MELLDKLNWRYATKAMNGQKIPQEKIDNIIEAISLAPTSSGLQPFEVYVITNQEVKDKIKPIAWNQSVVSDCSHLLVFAAWDTYTEERINKMFDLVNDVRGFKNEGWENYRQMLLKGYPPRDPEENFNHATKQAYIAFSQAIAAAAFEEVDATPMEGIEPDNYDKILELENYKTLVAVAIGYRAEDDKNQPSINQKSRRDFEKVIKIV